MHLNNTKTAELGNLEARRQVAKLYRLGIGGEKNKKRETCKEAAIGGHAAAIYNLEADEWNAGRTRE